MDANFAKIKDITDYQDMQIKALNRALIMLINILVHKKVMTQQDESWVDRIKLDHKLSKIIDAENLMERVLELTSKVYCPQNCEEAANLARNIKTKVILPKLD